MTAHIGISSAWKTIAKQWIGVSGAWKPVDKMWIGVGGAWKEFYTAVSADAGPYSAARVTAAPTNATATLSILNDGTYSTTTAGGGANTGNWLLGGTAAEVEVYLSGSGDTPTGAALNTWLSCGTTRSWSLSAVSGSKSFTGTLQMRNATTLEALDSQSCTITAESTV